MLRLRIAAPIALAGGGNSDASNACKQGGWQNLVRQDGTDFKNQGDCVSYAVKGGVLKAKPTGGSVPVLTLTGNGSATSAPITTAETVVYAGKYTNGAAPVPNATVGLTVFHGYDCLIGQGFYTDASYTTTDASGNYSKESGTPPGAGQYSAQTNVGSNLSNCVNIPVTEVPAMDEFANGDVNFAVELGDPIGLLTGNVTFAAQGTTTNATGQLAMTNSLGWHLNGDVTCFNRIDAKTAVFSGSITDASPLPTPGYFIAKVIDNGSSGDKIVVFVNEHGTANCSDPANDGLPGGDILADVTSGNLVVH